MLLVRCALVIALINNNRGCRTIFESVGFSQRECIGRIRLPLMSSVSSAPAPQWSDRGSDSGEHRVSRSRLCPAAHPSHLPRSAEPRPADVPLLLAAGHPCPPLTG